MARCTVDYDYDALQRLTKESISGAQTAVVSYAGTGTGQGYDPVGNRRSRQVTSGSLSSVNSYTSDTFDSRDKLTRSGYSYDDNGNTLGSDAGASDFYDAENHLIKRTQVGQPDIVMTYDADGNRVSKSVGGTVTTYLVDDRNPTGYAQVLEERDAYGTTTTGYMYGLSLVAQYAYDPASHEASIFYYGFDGLGSVRYLMDYMGNLTDTYTYDAFGIQIASTGTTPNDYRYAGQQWDPDLGMYYLRARYYKPDVGRFWTADSYEGAIEDALSLHKYLYCQDNPINRTDPNGNFDFGFEPMGFDSLVINPNAGKNALLKTIFTHGPVGRMLVGHWLSCQGTPVMLTKDEMVEIGAISAITLDPPTITEGEGFDQFRNQLTSGPVHIHRMRLFLGATEKATLGRFFAYVSGTLSGSPDSWTFSGSMNFRDRIKFDQSPSGTPDRNEMCALVNANFVGKDFEVYSESAAIKQSYKDNEIQWIGTGKRNPKEGVEWYSAPEGLVGTQGETHPQ